VISDNCFADRGPPNESYALLAVRLCGLHDVCVFVYLYSGGGGGPGRGGGWGGVFWCMCV
jgi:hypothetical protein